MERLFMQGNATSGDYPLNNTIDQCIFREIGKETRLFAPIDVNDNLTKTGSGQTKRTRFCRGLCEAQRRLCGVRRGGGEDHAQHNFQRGARWNCVERCDGRGQSSQLEPAFWLRSRVW